MTSSVDGTITAIGHSSGLTLSAEVLEALGLQRGDKVHLVKTDQGYLITPYDPQFDRAMAIYRAESNRYYDTHKALADA